VRGAHHERVHQNWTKGLVAALTDCF
jgi:hypothetical protein